MRTLELAALRGRKLDPVKHYLAQARHLSRLTPAQETALFHCIASAEQSAREVFFTIPGVTRHSLAVAARLLAGKERFARVVDPRRAPSRRAYLAALPALIKATRRNERAAAASWTESATSDAVGSKAGTCYEEYIVRLQASLPEFRFKVCVYWEYAAMLQPVVEDITRCLRPFRDIPRSTATENSLNDLPLIRRRLERHAARHRLAPAELIARLNDAEYHEAKAAGARAMLTEAHLRLVIARARKLVNSRRSFLDLIMAGNVALLRAIDTFDSSGDEAFTPYARRIVGAAIAKAAK